MPGAPSGNPEGPLLSRVPLHTCTPWLIACLALTCSSLVARAVVPARDGSLSPAVRAASDAGLFAIPDRTGLRTSTAPADWWVPVVLVGFADSTIKYSPGAFTASILDTTHSTPTGSVPDYYQWATGGRVRFRGEVVASVQLPRPESYYGNLANGLSTNTPRNDYGLVVDAMIAADSAVDWNRFDRDGDGFVDMVWIVHAGLGGEGTQSRQSLWSITSRLSQGWGGGTSYATADLVPNSSTRHVRVDRFTILPEISMFQPGGLSEIGVFCHEFGHALGLPDLYDTTTLGGAANVGPGNWSLMSSGVYGGDGHSPQYPVHMGGWALQFLGLQQLQRPSKDTLVVLSPLSRGGPLFDLSFQGESRLEHFLVEARYKEGFDRNLPASGLLVTQVDDGVIGSRVISNRVISSLLPAYRVVEGDGDFDLVAGVNRGDASDVLPGSGNVSMLDDDTTPWLRTFAGAPTNLSIDTIRRAGSTTIADLHVRAAGWLPIEDSTEPGFTPVSGAGHGRRALIDGFGASSRRTETRARVCRRCDCERAALRGSGVHRRPSPTAPRGRTIPFSPRCPWAESRLHGPTCATEAPRSTTGPVWTARGPPSSRSPLPTPTAWRPPSPPTSAAGSS